MSSLPPVGIFDQLSEHWFIGLLTLTCTLLAVFGRWAFHARPNSMSALWLSPILLWGLISTTETWYDFDGIHVTRFELLRTALGNIALLTGLAPLIFASFLLARGYAAEVRPQLAVCVVLVFATVALDWLYAWGFGYWYQDPLWMWR